MKNVSRHFLWLIISSFLLSPVASAQNTNDNEPDLRYLQVMLGSLDTDEAWTITGDNGDTNRPDWSNLIYGGVAAQLAWDNSAFQYGFESGGLISFRSDTNYFFQSNGGARGRVEFKNTLWIVDVSLGGFVSFRPWQGFRFYVSGGPSVMIGSLNIDDDDVEVRTLERGNGETIEFRPSTWETDADVGLYGRVGFDIILNNGFLFGLSARKINGELDFGKAGVIELDDTQYFLTVGKAF